MLKIKRKTTCWDKTFLVLTGLLLFINISLAQTIPARPNPPRLVNDYADILSNSEEYALEQKLVNYSDTTSIQICVVTVNDLSGTTSDDFAQKLGEKWGVGTKNNNGVVILVKPKTADELGDVSIQVGYGMEPYVTDAVNYGIRTKVMIPAFKENDYYKGIDGAVDAIIGLASGAYKSDKYTEDDISDGKILAVLIIALFIYIVIKAFIHMDDSGSHGSGKGSFWKGLLWGLLLSGTRGGGGSSWSGSRGGSWGGSSSGGFGGFGGGHFGGGGGSSKW